ncbi:alanine racemase [Hippea jasoniae]|uniref:alanine racemase n=1 Tax=Hippea jasoniae TaxID=944479 RepID=UPI0005514030|nr:alanine racemase [Hippea jasoniae]
MTEQYEKPVITLLKSGLMNKFGTLVGLQKIRKDIDGVLIEELVNKYRSPLFVFSEKKLREKFREFKNAFSLRYPNVEFSWSYKTNYLDAICAILHSEGETAEVVSEFEYDKARRLGIPGEKIIYNGPFKPIESLKKAAEEGARINIDHFEEISDLEKVSEELSKTINVAIRVNMDTGIHPQWSRFGFNIENGQAWSAAKRIFSGGKLKLNGLHCHIGTFILEPNAYKNEVKKMIDLAYRIEDELGFKIEYFDIGGGFPSKNRLRGLYMPPEISIPSIDQFAESVCDTLLTNLRPNDYPKLIIESGRAIVDEAGFLIATVHASKRLPDGKRAYIIDAGVNILFTAFWYHFNIEFDRIIEGVAEPSILYGPLCMNIDVIDDHLNLPPLTRGTKLVISPVGAYNTTQWMQFIRYRPNVVLVGINGEVDLIRKAETLENIIEQEYLPERLKIKTYE